VRSWLVLVALCALAALLRFYRLDAQSLWYDEGISAHQLTRSFPEIAAAAARDTHPPLYYWLLKVWGQAFGATELGLRSLSALLGVAAVGLTWLIGRRLFGGGAALVTGVLLACSPLAVYYSQEVRMYALVLACGLLASWGYVRGSLWLYVVGGAAAVYSQYLGAAFLVALNLHALLWWRSRSAGGWLRWLGANALIGLIFLPWLATFLDQSSQRALNTSPRTAGGLLADTLTAYGGGLARSDLALVGGGLLVALALLGAVLAARRDRAGPAPAARPTAGGPSPAATGRASAPSGWDWYGVSLALLLWLVPLALVEGLGLRSGLFELRYLVLSLPGLALLAGCGVARLAALPARIFAGPVEESGTLWPAGVGGVIAAVLVGMLLIPASDGLLRQAFDPALARDDYRGVVSAIEGAAQPNDAVVLAAPNQVEVFGFYYHGPLAVVPLPAQRPIDPADTRRRLEALKADHERVWLVSWAMPEADPNRVIEGWLAENGYAASHRWFGGVQLELFALSRGAAPLEPLDLPFDNGITLVGYRVTTRALAPGETLGLSLVWRAETTPAERWTVFTHLVDERPKVVAQRDSEPNDGLRPTTTWRAGGVVEDNYGITLPPELAPGRYAIEVGLYRGDVRARLPDGTDHLLLGQVEVR
jgi:mannosyltransferase